MFFIMRKYNQDEKEFFFLIVYVVLKGVIFEIVFCVLGVILKVDFLMVVVVGVMDFDF